MSLDTAIVQEFKSKLDLAKNVLIALPAQVTVDKLAFALSLHLGLESLGKKVGVVSADTIRVSHTALFGIDKVKQELPVLGGGNMILTLDNVVTVEGSQSGSVTALEKLDWYPEGANLNLVFHVLPGHKFEPTNISHRYEGEGYDLVITVGVSTLNDLGDIYQKNKTVFDSTPLVNIDNDQINAQYGAINLVDPMAPSLSEMLPNLLKEVGFTLETDTATNIVTGIYDATHNLTAAVTADTFYAVAQSLQAGGKIPTQASITPSPAPTPAPTQTQPQAATQVPTPAETKETTNPQWFSLNQQGPNVTPPPVVQETPQPTPVQTVPTPPVAEPLKPPTPRETQPGQPQGRHNRPRHHRRDDRRERDPLRSGSQPNPANQPSTQPPTKSQEEAPHGEAAYSGNPEMGSSPAPDWLTPKVYRGGKIE